MSVVDEDGVVASGSDRSDVELIAAVRAGDMAAFGELWSRHEGAARRFAASVARPGDVEELVSESFFRVLRAINGGGGPNAAFRAYLFQAMRNANVDVGRAYLNRVVLTDQDRLLDVEQAASAADISGEEAERSAAVRAWASLPEGSRTLLWHLLIEEETPAQIAPILGISPNGVSSRAVRAKERLRQAFLQQQLAAADDDACVQARSRFGAYVRGALPESAAQQVERHLAECTRGCPAALLEITDINRTLRAVVAPALLGGSIVAAKYIGGGVAAASTAAAATGAAASGAGGTAASKGGAGSLLQMAAKAPALIGATTAVACAVIATLLLTQRPHRHQITEAGGLNETSRTTAQDSPTPPASSSTARSSRPSEPARTAPARQAQRSSPEAVVAPPPLLAPPNLADQPRMAAVNVMSAAGSAVSTLSATLPAGWRFDHLLAPQGAVCREAGLDATCRIAHPAPGAHRFVFYVLPPAGTSSGTLRIDYSDASGSTTQNLPL